MRPTIGSLLADLRSRRITAREVAEDHLARAAADRDINAFITLTADQALAQADRIDRMIADGADPGPLAGIPVAVKDLFDVAGVPTTAGSRRHADRVATGTATAVERLLTAGAVLVGKANMDMFAFGPNQQDYGRTNCPADLGRYAGGSSGGSAAAVAAGLAVAALGSDAGGSTRFPAGCCGVVGYKPTFGRVPTDGIRPTFASLDHVGLVAGTVDDVRTLFGCLAGRQGVAEPHGRPRRLVVPAGWERGCEPAVVRAVESGLAALSAAGALLEHREVAGFDESIDLLLATVAPEAALELGPELDAGDEGLPSGMVDLLRAGRQATAVDYLRAQRRRAELTTQIDGYLDGVDAIALPTSTTTAWAWADLDADVLGARADATRFLPLANLTGHPAISLPLPVEAGSLPVGLQLIGGRGADERLLALARWVERTLGPQPPAG